MTECIHGLDEQLCDICSPRKNPEPQEAPVATRTRAAARTTSPRLASASTALPRTAPSRAAAAKRPAAETLPDVNLATMRVHHWTHVSNLELILADGRLQAGAVPEIDVSSPEDREIRAATALPTGTTVAGHVPFSLSPEGAPWNDLRSGASGPRWSAAARSSKPTDYLVFVVPVTALPATFVVADGESTARETHFGRGLEEGRPLVRRASLADPELLAVEVLVPDAVDLMAVTLIGVPNDKVRDRVKSLVRAAGGASPRVAIYPPWFRPIDD